MAVPERFYFRSPITADYWRAVVLFGRNVASYKFALAKALLELRPGAGSLLRLEDLAEPFSRHICEHLKLADKQGTSGSSQFLDACRGYNQATVTKEQLLATTARLGFVNVIGAFHVVNQRPIPRTFFVDERQTSRGIRITDEFAVLLASESMAVLPAEAEARWRLVETAWALGVARQAVIVQPDPNLEELFVAGSGSRRVSITSCRAALNGYQKGRCFYCFRDIEAGITTDVDHFFPHVLKDHGFGSKIDGVWNLVLACPPCNRGSQGKFARVPSARLLDRLWARNEYLIASHHPLQETLMLQMGATEADRRAFLRSTYQAALEKLIHEWEPEVLDDDPFA